MSSSGYPAVFLGVEGSAEYNAAFKKYTELAAAENKKHADYLFRVVVRLKRYKRAGKIGIYYKTEQVSFNKVD